MGNIKCRISKCWRHSLRILVAVVVVLIGRVVISDIVTPPVGDFKSGGIATFHPDGHLLDPSEHWECRTLIVCNTVTGL